MVLIISLRTNLNKNITFPYIATYKLTHYENKKNILLSPKSYKSLNMKHYRNFSLNKKKKLLFIFLFFNIFYVLNTPFLKAEIEEFINPRLKTVLLNRIGWELSYPLITLNSSQQLQLKFDELGGEVNNYYYIITLCDANWEKASLMTTEYLRGVPEQPILEYEYSFNTTFDYVHYTLNFPNNDLQVTKSGNYIISVYEDSDKENPLIIKRFMVAEQLVTISPTIKFAAQSSRRGAYQEVGFEVLHQGVNIQDATQEVEATIIQNGRTDNMISGLKPLYVQHEKLNFNYNRETLMEAGNEFRYADLRTFRFVTDRVHSIEFVDPFYHFTLYPDFSRKDESYHYFPDINGRYKIEVREYDDYHTQADYAFVHFYLREESPNLLQKVYINGALTNWQLNETAEMDYNPDINGYEKTLLLKQGYYNYQYIVKDGYSDSGDVCYYENCYQETENDFLILVYYKPMNERNHRLIGVQNINSRKR